MIDVLRSKDDIEVKTGDKTIRAESDHKDFANIFHF